MTHQPEYERPRRHVDCARDRCPDHYSKGNGGEAEQLKGELRTEQRASFVGISRGNQLAPIAVGNARRIQAIKQVQKSDQDDEFAVTFCAGVPNHDREQDERLEINGRLNDHAEEQLASHDE
jgi:hypothetical protein